jgi:hypothetical protein
VELIDLYLLADSLGFGRLVNDVLELVLLKHVATDELPAKVVEVVDRLKGEGEKLEVLWKYVGNGVLRRKCDVFWEMEDEDDFVVVPKRVSMRKGEESAAEWVS